jgi:hypothetical protein
VNSCANPGCDKPLPARGHTGRPAIYCSPACRQRRPRTRPGPAAKTPAAATPDAIVVELDHPAESPDGRAIQRVWTLQLRRHDRVVVIAEGLGWPTANALARQLTQLITDTSPTPGAAID